MLWPGLSSPAASLIHCSPANRSTGRESPPRIIPESPAIEVWEYVKSGDFIAPGRETIDFNVGPKPFGGATGGITTLKQGERISEYENIWRFKIKDGKVKGWYAARTEGGRVVWEDH